MTRFIRSRAGPPVTLQPYPRRRRSWTMRVRRAGQPPRVSEPLPVEPITAVCGRLEAKTERTNRQGRSSPVPAYSISWMEENQRHRHGQSGWQPRVNRPCQSCASTARAIDTLHAMGGDEFARVLPETLHDEAEPGHRIRAVMASDPEYPRLLRESRNLILQRKR